MVPPTVELGAGPSQPTRPKARFGQRPKVPEDDGYAGTNTVPERVEELGEEPSYLLPKVMAPFETAHGSIPRKVLIERRKRQYQAQDLSDLLQQEGVDLKRQRSPLPLEPFDNEDYETRLPHQWVPGGEEGEASPAPARVLVDRDDGVPTWEEGIVHSYNTETGLYRVTVGEHAMELHRVRIYFRAEDPAIFARRFSSALRDRAAADAALRVSIYVDSMPMDDVSPMPSERASKILGLTLNSKKLRERHQDTARLNKELMRHYSEALNHVSFRKAKFPKELSDLSINCGFEKVEPEMSQPSTASLSAALHLLQSVDYDYNELSSEFCFRSLLTNVQVISALGKVKVENAKVLKMHMFNVFLNKVLRLEEFEQLQLQACDQVAMYLRDTWTTTIKNIIKSTFRDVGKGWFNLQETKMETYEVSKLRKFLVLVKLMVEDVLRTLIEDNLAHLVQIFRRSCDVDVGIRSLSDVASEPRGGDRAAPGGAGSRVNALFLFEMDIEDGHVVYSTSMTKVTPLVTSVFDHAITCVQGIPQLEPQIVENLFWSSQPVYQTPHPQEDRESADIKEVGERRPGVIVPLRQELHRLLAEALEPAQQYLDMYRQFEPFLQTDIPAYVQKLAEAEDFTLKTVLKEIQDATAIRDQWAEALPTKVQIGPLSISTKKVREALLERKTRQISLLRDLCSSVPKRLVMEASRKYEEMNRQLKVPPTCIEDVDAQRTFIEELPKRIRELQHEVEKSLEWYDALEDMRYLLRDDDSKAKFTGLLWPIKLQRQVEYTQETLQQEESKYKNEMKSEQDAFVDEIGSLEMRVGHLNSLTKMDNLDHVSTEVKLLQDSLKQAEKDAQLYNSRESLMGLPITDYSKIKKVMEGFEPFFQFWTVAAQWRKQHLSWMNDSWTKLEPDAVEREVMNTFKTMFKVARVFQGRTGQAMSDYAANADTIRAEVEDFKKFVPLVHALRNPGMRDRHWDQLTTELEMDLHPGPSFTLVQAQKMGLLSHLDHIVKVADVAGKEYSIETALNKMQREWESASLQVLDYRETGTFVIKLEEQVTQQLDDHIVLVQSMGFSPYKKPFEQRIADWEKQLNLVSEMLDAWLALQRAWMYLEPIFSSEDIQHQLPVEAKKFTQVDRLWRKTLGQAKQTPHLLTMCGSSKLLEQFQDCNKQLESVQKGLADYLETKRLAFARFFFLSNDELLQILSQTKNPLAVQPHLRKCFEAIESLDFAPNLEITAMNSKEKEKVPFDKKMMPDGNVESWLGEVERRMKASVRNQIAISLEDYVQRPRTEWVRNWPAMVVLAGSGIFWSKGVEDAIRAADVQGFLEKSHAELMDLTDLVRGKLSVQDQLTLGALITIDVHARDVVQQLVDAGVQRPTDFEWVSQLRYYWRDDVFVEMVQACIPYGYEYLGNTPRLVITPLTDRCYMTLMSAMHLNLGGAPAGPAGTGKTETTKDLAKAMAKQCVVFNCSDGLDYLAMGKFFKGLASAGAWACFDEFNRIDLEVLSVVAQQILTIQLSIQAKVKRFIFEDTEIELNPACSVYITMNPGYAGRSELPDNLKALFRPCAMMVPDYALIAEICLYSFGYRNAKNLARKMVATFKLCSEQLSSQDHYDYGMRAVKSVITAAGNLKRDFPDDDEEVLVLRGLRDVNVPKFLSHDLPLFAGIITDLFPGVEPPKVDYDAMIEALGLACHDLKIQPVDPFIHKVIQLYETTLVRHGLMLVGPTMGGKTCCYRSLQKAMGKLKAKGVDRFEKVRVVALNPKSITMGQLYGEFDDDTHEWTDGVLACYMRECASDTRPDKKWIMFDGPVDAVWIENMNTVLDDNKKLCLVSGEIIQMTPQMTMMFEVEDLAVASPATVSRCGMVYIEPTAMGMEPLLQSWLESLPEALEASHDMFRSLFRRLVVEGVRFVRRSLKETVATVNHNLCMSCFRLFDALVRPYRRSETDDPLTPDERAAVARLAAPLFLFSVVWSVGASCDKNGRAKFDAWIRETLDGASELTVESNFPKDRTVYDWCYDIKTLTWVDWMTTVPNYVCNPDMPFSEILVPTADTVRYTFVLDRLLANNKHVLCVGETGTGKSVNVAKKLMTEMPADVDPVFITFSARTSANMTQDMVDAKMDKRRKGVFGPPSGKRYVIFVDDLNMPAREKYFAQPPIELLRQWMDHEGWYDRKPPCMFKQLVDIMFVGAMGPPGGGRNPVTNRFLRHFHFLSFTDMSDESVGRIFSTILHSYFSKYFNDPVTNITDSLVAATTDLYNTIREELLPTPSKVHYTFNLRDMAKVVQGVMRADGKIFIEPKQVMSLWLHEAMRVFKDRLINDEDSQWFDTTLGTLLKKHFSLDWTDVVSTDRLVYGDYLVPGADPRSYVQITDMTGLMRIVEEYLEDYNSVSSKPMKLVMFLDAIEHVSRICRVIRLPLGNALLLGVGGSGRQSLTRLACSMEDFELHQIEIAKGYGLNEWRDDLKKVLKKAGISGANTVFLFTDTQILQERQLEDLNNILNAGEVPNLFGNDDMEEIAAAMRPLLTADGLPVTKMAIYSYFVKRVRSLLHLVICMSPIGDAFRQRLRMFPSLVNCCTIDWFREWPMEALTSVANSFYMDVPLSDDASPNLLEGVVECCVHIHQSVERVSRRYYDELRRYNYVTPTSYLELLTTFIKLLGEKRDEINTTRSRLEIGLEKLMTTAAEVEVMQKELQELQPVLVSTRQEVEDMMVVITHDKKEADETKEVVSRQEAEANQQAAQAKAIKADAQKDLDEALPALDAALESLKNLSRNDIVEVKSLANPPQGVRMVMEAACIMFDEKPKMVNDPNKPGKKIADYWDVSKKLLNDPTKFLDSLMTYDKENIPTPVISKIEPYIQMEEFTPEAVSKVSKACTSICMWARAMYIYHNVSLGVEPKRRALAAAEEQLAKTMAELAEAQAKLRAVEDKIAALTQQYDEATAKKEALERQALECQQRLERADKLIGGLGGERTRWQATVEQLAADLRNVVGDVVVAAGTIAYSGPFTPTFRAILVQDWTTKLLAAGVPHSPGTNIIKTLQDPVKIRAWNIAGLPTDSVSVENGIIVSKARRWPLMIDPREGQANRWIKNMEREAGLDVVKLSDKDFLRTLENGVRFGRAVLLENIGEGLDAAIEPVLLKQTFKQGGSEVIKIGDNIIPYHPDFRFYTTTKLLNPHYPPEVAVKVSLLNFFVTLEGLEEQLLNITVTEERPDLSEMKSQLVVSNARMKKELKEIEDRILYMLSHSEGNILDDEELINTLAQSKATSNEIAFKVAEAEKTEKEIDETRNLYRPVAVRASLLFFCIADLALVDPMYQYSLGWFISLFIRGIAEAPRADDIIERGKNLNNFFTYSLYVNVCRSLFEKHKLMFSFLLTIKIMQHVGMIDPIEWRFLLAGPTSSEVGRPNPAPEWLTEKSWIELANLSRLPAFSGFDIHFSESVEHYQALFDSNEAQDQPLASPYEDSLNRFQKLLFLRTIRPDKCVRAIQLFVAENLGHKFIEPPPFDLATCYKESSPSAPLIFVLSPGADPMADLLKLAEDMKFTKKFEKVSLGQGQGPKAEKVLLQGMDRGMWVCLQNCHLAVSWMPTLERIVENIAPEKVHKDFRLWLTSMPSPDFPVTILQNGVKMTLEPPKGLKANLLRSYNRMTDHYLSDCKKPSEWRKLLFGLCLFHAVIQDRRKFGPLGWNIRYDFTDGDLMVSLTQMRQYLDEYDEIPYRVLRFLVSEINYGGRVTDDKDRRLMNNLLVTFCSEDVVETGYRYSPSGVYTTPGDLVDSQISFLELIRELPIVPKPEIFGLHENADITCDQNETYEMFSTILYLQPRVSAGKGASREDVIMGKCQEILSKVPSSYDIEAVQQKYPTTYRESMNTVLTQECIRYNGLLTVMKGSLQDTIKALKGLVVMSPELEAVSNSIFDNQVPAMWEAKAYPSLKPLSTWVVDLLERTRFVSEWIDKGCPAVYWISGFFFPQAFLTGTLQNYARKYALPIDTVSFDFQVMDHLTADTCAAGPEDGCYIRGLFLEGARWNEETHLLDESRPKELYSDVPILWLKPAKGRVKPSSGLYDCPLYKTLTRAGTLSTTGHSTNYIVNIELPTDKAERFWIGRGTAAFASLA